MKVKVEVKRKHIKAGKPGFTGSCPIALALKDKGFREVDVDESDMIFVKDDKKWGADTTTKAQRFIRKFDFGKSVEPFSFTLNCKEW